MSIRYIELTDLNDNVLYPRTHWNAIVDKPNVATIEQLALKQDILTSANAGTNVTITSEGGVIKINATGTGGATSYNDLTDKPSINGTTLQGALSLAELGINIPTAVSQLTNDAHYVNEDQLDTKQDVLSSANAGANVSITFVDGVPKINAVGGSGTGDYNNLINRPTLNGATIAGAYTLGTGLTIANKVISVTGLPTIAITASGGYLSTITLNGTTYSAPPVVSANPSGTITRTLTSLRINGVDYNINPAVAGVTAIGGATGAITLGTHLAISGQQLRVTDMPSISITTDNTTHLVNTITLNNTTYNVLSSVTTGVTSFGGRTGAITISNDFTMSGNTLQLARGIPTIVINPSGIQPTSMMSTFTLNGTTYGLQANTIHGAPVGGDVYFNTNHFSLSNNQMSLNSNVLVTANGSDSPTATLTKIKVGGVTYGLAAGTTIDGHSGALTLNAAHLAISQAGEISVTNLPPTYSAGDGISLSNNEISILYDASHLAISDHNQLQVTNLPPVVSVAGTAQKATSITVGNNTYAIAYSPVVTAYSATGDVDATLRRLKVDDIVYDVSRVTSLGGKTDTIGLGDKLTITTSGSTQTLNVTGIPVVSVGGTTEQATSITVDNTTYAIKDTTYSSGSGISITGNNNAINNTGVLGLIVGSTTKTGNIELGNHFTLTEAGTIEVTGIPSISIGGETSKATSITLNGTTYTIAYSPVVSRSAGSANNKISQITIGGSTYNIEDTVSSKVTSLSNGDFALNGVINVGSNLVLDDATNTISVTGIPPAVSAITTGTVTGTKLLGLTIGSTTYKIDYSPVVARTAGSANSKISQISIGSSTYNIEDASPKVNTIDEKTGKFSLGTYLTATADSSSDFDWKLDVTGIPVVTANAGTPGNNKISKIQIGTTSWNIVDTTSGYSIVSRYSGTANNNITAITINGSTYNVIDNTSSKVRSIGTSSIALSGDVLLDSYFTVDEGTNTIGLTNLPPVVSRAAPASGTTITKINIGANAYDIVDSRANIVPVIANSGTPAANSKITKISIDGTSYKIVDETTVHVDGLVVNSTTKTGTVEFSNQFIVDQAGNIAITGIPSISIGGTTAAATSITLNGTTYTIKDTTYSQGDGITISGTTISNAGVVSFGTKNGAITIDSTHLSMNGNQLQVTNLPPTVVAYTSGDDVDGILQRIQIGELTYGLARVESLGGKTGDILIGSHISLTENAQHKWVLSAEDTTYSQGTGITITGTTISANTATASANGIGRVAADSTAANMNVSYSGGVATIKGKYKMSLSDTILTIEELF